MDEITQNKAPKGPNLPYVKGSLAAIEYPRSRSAPETPSGECHNQVIHGCLDASSRQLGDKIYTTERRRSTSNGEESRIGSDNVGNTKPQKNGKSLKSPGSNSFTSVKKSRRPSRLRSRSDSPAISSLKMSSRGLSNPKKHSDKSEEPSEAGIDNPDLGPFLLNRARDLISSGDNPQKALKYALRAVKSFEKCTSGKPNLDLVMCLHVIASIHCKLGEFGEAVPVLERSIEIPAPDGGHDHALALFSGYMQLGDTYAMLGQLKSSILCYTRGLEVQILALGDTDPRIGETCRYLAEAHVQVMELVEAERLCRIALDIHRKSCGPASLEEIVDRRLMALICDTKGDHEAALEHLVLASMAMVANNQEAEAAAVDASIGDTYLALARYEEAVFAYQKALTVFKTTKGENHPTVASIFVRLADLYNKTGKFRDSKSYCENALRIYAKPLPGVSAEEIASGLTDISAIYESMNDTEQALKLLQNALKIYKDASGQQRAIAGIEAQIGALHCMTGNYDESYVFLNNSITKLRACGENKCALFGIALNQMGLACVQRYAINEAAELFEESRSILEQEYGPDHPETLGVYSNLAGTYDAMGRLDEAIEILEYVVGIREEKLGTANPDVDDEKRRLAVLLKEAGRPRSRRTKSLENLLDINSFFTKSNSIAA